MALPQPLLGAGVTIDAEQFAPVAPPPPQHQPLYHAQMLQQQHQLQPYHLQQPFVKVVGVGAIGGGVVSNGAGYPLATSPASANVLATTDAQNYQEMLSRRAIQQYQHNQNSVPQMQLGGRELVGLLHLPNGALQAAPRFHTYPQLSTVPDPQLVMHQFPHQNIQELPSNMYSAQPHLQQQIMQAPQQLHQQLTTPLMYIPGTLDTSLPQQSDAQQPFQFLQGATAPPSYTPQQRLSLNPGGMPYGSPMVDAHATLQTSYQPPDRRSSHLITRHMSFPAYGNNGSPSIGLPGYLPSPDDAYFDLRKSKTMALGQFQGQGSSPAMLSPPAASDLRASMLLSPIAPQHLHADGNTLHQPQSINWFNMPEPPLTFNRTLLSSNAASFDAFPAQAHAAPQFAQSLGTMPPDQFPTLRLIGSSANRYAGAGEYWDSSRTEVVIEGNLPLAKSVRRLKHAVVRADKVRDHVARRNDISMPMMGWMAATCEDLCASTEEMSVDFEGEGGIVAILATCVRWTYRGSDGVTAGPQDIEPIWEEQFTVAARVAQVRLELVEPLTNFVTPFASAMSARSRARAGDVTAAMISLLTYEARHGGPRIAHWVVLRSWGCGSAAMRPADALDSAWVSAEAVARGVSPPNPNATTTAAILDLSLLPDTAAGVAWSMFPRVMPPMQLAPSPASGRVGVLLLQGEYHVLADRSLADAAARETVSQMDALLRVVTAVGSKAALAACGYPHMPDGISPLALRDLCQLTSHRRSRTRAALAALAGITLTRGKKPAVRALLAAVSLVARLGDRLDRQPVVVRRCAGGMLIHSTAVLDLLAGRPPSHLSWLCLPGSKVRLVLICNGNRGDVRCLGTATFVGTTLGPPEGAGATIC
ncbi:hypothetical protein HK405_010624 [Cladochytrium tenue]|nr:hypothetical protein HK405_010624 [Cladochytrium tenue]